MRKEFCRVIKDIATADKNVVFITGDLGYAALEELREAIGPRFINGGVSEQNIISTAAALASEGLRPICYSIAPFIVFRPAEQIRLDVCLHNLDVKIVGNGGGYGYGIMGATHHAIEDIAVLSSFQNMRCFIPWCSEDVEGVTKRAIDRVGPAYIRLNVGKKPDSVSVGSTQPIRKILAGEKVTLVALGPIVLNALEAIEADPLLQNSADVFVVSEMPLAVLPRELIKSIERTGKLIVIEEHVSRGGLGENLFLEVAKKGTVVGSLTHLHASGYPNGLYGGQKYHQTLAGLDAKSIGRILRKHVKK